MKNDEKDKKIKIDLSKKKGDKKSDVGHGHDKDHDKDHDKGHADTTATATAATIGDDATTSKPVKISKHTFFNPKEVDNTPVVQREAHVVSHKKCQTKEDKGCCEGYIDLVSKEFFFVLFTSLILYIL